jgi:hypothetical protein
MAELDGKKKPSDKEADLAEIARVFGPVEGEMIKNFLEGHGIPCIVQGRMAPFVYPFTVDGLAEYKVLVPEEDREKAKDLIAGMPSPDDLGGPEKAG